MPKTYFRGCLLLTALLTACGTSNSPAPQVTQGIEGTVVTGVAGDGLNGAAVLVLDGSGQEVARTRTDKDGHYKLTLPPGTYTVTSPGQPLRAPVNQGGEGIVPFASSTVTGVRVTTQDVTTQHLVQLPAVAGSNPTTPPTVSVRDLDVSLDAQGTVDPSVHVTTDRNSVTFVAAAIGHTPVLQVPGQGSEAVFYLGGSLGEARPTSQVDVRALNGPTAVATLAAGVSGDTQVQVLATDSNNDRTVALLPVQVTNVPVGTSLGAPVSDVNVVAYTVRNTRLNLQQVQPQPQAGGVLTFVSVSWTPYAFPVPTNPAAPHQGYWISRRVNGGPLNRVGTVPVTVTAKGGQSTVVNPSGWQDTDPTLRAGDVVQYSVQAYDGTQLTPLQEEAQARAELLAPLDLRLDGPAENAARVSLTPTFRWTTNRVGTHQYFVPAVADTLQGGSAEDTPQGSPTFCGLAPVALGKTYVANLLQHSGMLSNARGFPATTSLCGVVGGPTRDGYTFTYQPSGATDYDGVLPPLQAHRAYQWRLLDAVAVDDPNDPHALSIATSASGLFLWGTLLEGRYTFDGDLVRTFTTGEQP